MPSETFDADWLTLREPADHRARAEAHLEGLLRWWVRRGGSRIVDLGSGTGSNLRYLSPRLPGAQAWTLVDQDAELLARAAVGAPSSGVRVVSVIGDLADEGLTEAAQADLVTGSALLDLVSGEWVLNLVRTCRDAHAAALFTLTYDGSVKWGGATDPSDTLVLEAVNAHQRTDKGVGPALGPTATEFARDAFAAAGFQTRVRPSPWTLGPADAVLTAALLEGWAAAATEQRPECAQDIAAWADRRRGTIERGSFALTVGHADLLALPEEQPGASP